MAKFTKAQLSGDCFTDLELFQMFNIDVGAAMVANVKFLRRSGLRFQARETIKTARKFSGQMMWNEISRQKSGVVHDFDASEKVNSKDAVKARVAKMREFYQDPVTQSEEASYFDY